MIIRLKGRSAVAMAQRAGRSRANSPLPVYPSLNQDAFRVQPEQVSCQSGERRVESSLALSVRSILFALERPADRTACGPSPFGVQRRSWWRLVYRAACPPVTVEPHHYLGLRVFVQRRLDFTKIGGVDVRKLAPSPSWLGSPPQSPRLSARIRASRIQCK